MQEKKEQALKQYQKELLELYQSTKANELSFRTPFENLLKSLAPKGYKIIQEPKSEKEQSSIRPDFKVYKLIDKENELSYNSLVGFIECKNIDVDLKKHIKSEQLSKYLKISPNILLSNYKSFILLSFDRIVFELNLFDEALKPLLKDSNEFFNLIQSFFDDTNTSIKSKQELIKVLSTQSFYLSYVLKDAYDDKSKINSFHNFFRKTFDTFKEIQKIEFSEAEFCDILAQSIVYGLFVSLVENEKFEIEKIPIELFNSFLPEYFKTLNEFLYFALPSFSIPKSVKYSLENVKKVLSLLDKEAMSEFLKTELESIVIYLYEDFLKAYDELRATQKRKEGGVFYTPPSVVKAIVASCDELLQTKFNKSKGFGDEGVKVLDFATGTGSFLAEVFEYVLKREKKIFKIEGIRKFLENIYGFELNFASYVVARLKLGQILKKQGFKDFSEVDFQIYLNNTLDLEKDANFKLSMPLENLDEEWKKARDVKCSKNLLVILGNPPYNAKSKNKGEKILELLQSYKQGLNEQKINLDDDYIKFIRFAQWKLLEQKNANLFESNKGLMGFITNNSYLSGRTHRKMRQSLLNAFDEIYILNLHGSDKDAKEDKNVFDIKIGVCISLFVKYQNESNKAKLFYYSTAENKLFKREEKFAFLENFAKEGLNSLKWQELEALEPYYFFVPKAFEHKEYENFWALAKDKATQSMQDSAMGGGLAVFENYGSGIKTDRDELVIDFEKENLIQKMQKAFSGNFDEKFKIQYKIHNSSSYAFEDKLKNLDFDEKAITTINYRCFDERFIYYKQGFTSRPAYETMQHFLQGENLGLCFCKFSKENDNSSSLLVNSLAESCVLVGNSGHSVVTPLYCYDESLNEKEGSLSTLSKIPNFTQEFAKYKQKHSLLTDKSPEQILAFIYANLFSPLYRKKYSEYLKIGFPRVNFEVSAKEFDFYEAIGQKLMALHLFQKEALDECLKDESIDFQGEFAKSTVLEALNEKQRFKENTLFLNEKIKIIGISQEIWEFKIGGYEVLKTWLKYRKNKELFKKDLYHLLSIELQKELEKE